MSTAIRKHNKGYSGGFPLAVGDRLYSQDLFRDFKNIEDRIGIGYNDLVQQSPPYVINGLVAVQGTGHTMDISAGKAVVPYQVTIPDTVAAWTVPPSTATANINAILDYAGVTGASLTGATADGATPNYVKLSYAETNGNTRTRAKKAGSYAYEVYDDVTLTIDSVAPTATEINLLTFTTDGATVTVTDNGDTRIGSPFHMQDAVVYNQTTFNDCITRVAANQYKIRDDIQSIYCANLSGGYLMTGGTSPLSGGDTWGYIETNNCQQIIFESGATIHMGNERGYLEINTDNCYLNNVSIVGTGTVASAIIQSFLLNGNYVKFYNCKTSSRFSTGNYAAFQGSSTAAHNDNSIYINCDVVDIDIQAGSNNGGFRNCKNLYNCRILNINYTGATSSGYGFLSCDDLHGCLVDTFTGAGLNNIAYRSCNYVVSCRAVDISTSLNVASGFSSCDFLINCVADNIISTASNVIGFATSNNLDGCSAININNANGQSYGYNTCNQLNNCISDNISNSSSNAHGFFACNKISNSVASTIDHNGSVAGRSAYGYNQCNNISSSEATDIDTNGAGGIGAGFYNCEYIVSSSSNNNTDYGFSDCLHVSSSFATLNSQYGFYMCIAVHNNESTNNGLWGFVQCTAVSLNRATGNPSGKYSGTVFADYGGTIAPADTATGGYNG